jgi:hypothetical protein
MFEGIIIYLTVVFLFAFWHLYCYLNRQHNPAYNDSQLLLHVFFVAYAFAVVLVLTRML